MDAVYARLNGTVIEIYDQYRGTFGELNLRGQAWGRLEYYTSCGDFQ